MRIEAMLQEPTEIIVTGASGFVGKQLVSHLAKAGLTGIATSRSRCVDLPNGWTWRMRQEMLESGAEPGEKNRVLIHLEVKHHVQQPTEAELQAFQTVNVDGTRAWLSFCERQSIHRVVYFSSIKAVSNSDERPCSQSARNSKPLDETAGTVGSTPYGRSKWEAEQLISRWAQENSKRSALIVRPAVVYGPGNTANLYAMVDAIAKGRFLLIGSNDNVKSLVSLTNLCAAIVHLLPRTRPGVEAFNIVDRESFSVRELASIMARELGVRWTGRSVPLPVAKAAARLGDFISVLARRQFPLTSPRFAALTETTHFSCQKLVYTGFQHPETTAEGIAAMVKWYKCCAISAARS